MTVPILMLTARDDEIDKVTGLDFGADDYMTKPFSMRELLARIRAMMRRVEIQASTPDTSIRFGNVEIDTSHHSVTKAGETLNLTPKEFDLLAFLVRTKALCSLVTSYCIRLGIRLLRHLHGGCPRAGGGQRR